MNNELFIDMLSISIIAGIISSQLIQKIKTIINLNTNITKIISLIISFGIGYTYAYCFYSHLIMYDIWIALFTLIGAERMYQTFKGSFGLKSNNNEK